MTPTFTHGYPLDKFTEYYRDTIGELGETERRLISDNPDQLIVWHEDDEIVGHAIWHPSDTSTHPDGEPREEDDRRILEDELGVRGPFIELHEVWLKETSRGRGHGTAFFTHFEATAKKRGFKQIVYYADHPAALTICRTREYKEAWGVELNGIKGETTKHHVLSKKL